MLLRLIGPSRCALAAAERGVFEDEIMGGDGSEGSLAATKKKMKEAAAKRQQGGGGGGFEMPKVEMPNPFGGMPNPFGKN